MWTTASAATRTMAWTTSTSPPHTTRATTTPSQRSRVSDLLLYTHCVTHCLSTEKKAKQPEKPKKAPKPAPPPPTASAYRPVKSAESEKDFLANLLAGIDSAPLPSAATKRSRKRKSSPEPVDFGSYRHRDDFPSSDPVSDALSDEPVLSPAKRIKTANGRSAGSSAFASDKSSSPAVAAIDIDDDDFGFTDDDLMAIDAANEAQLAVKHEEQDVKMPDVKPKPKVPVKKEEPPSWLSVHASLAVADPEWLNVALGSLSNAAQGSEVDAIEEDGSFRFFWLDYFEKDGTVHLVGKCRDKTTKAWASCCVTVEGIERNLYVLKREKKRSKCPC